MSTDNPSTSTPTPHEQRLPPAPGQIYGDERHATSSGESTTYQQQFRIVYLDSDRVLLKNTDEVDYRYERRDAFERTIGNRFTLLEETDTDDSATASIPDVDPLISMLEHRKEQHRQEDTGETTETVAAFDECISLLSNHQPAIVEWDDIDGIGSKTAENMVENGFTTDADLIAAGDGEVLDVPGMGEKTLSAAREYVDD